MTQIIQKNRTLGRSGIKVSPLGMGCWAIGGPFYQADGTPVGWGASDDAESCRALETAYERGINFYDTADIYGTGHSETLVGKVFANKRDKVVIATKFGFTFKTQTNTEDTDKRIADGMNASPDYIRSACEVSLKRLNTDYIDLYQFHLNDYSPENAESVRDTLEDLVCLGRIRAYGWSTDFPERAAIFAKGPNCAAIQAQMNVLDDNAEMVRLCEAKNLALINRGPLAMGLLSGKYAADSQLSADDVRGRASPDWMKYFKGGKPSPEWYEKVRAIRSVLTEDGRSLAQGALCWLWSRSPNTIPIPGIRTVAQAKENAGTMRFEKLSSAQIEKISSLLS